MADAYEIYNMSHTGEEIDAAVDKANAAVPQTRTVNGKALSADVTLSAKDVGALVKANLLDFVYLVGSIYMSVNSTSPASFLGETWEQLKDRFLLGAGDIYMAGAKGGEANVALLQDNIPQMATSQSGASRSTARVCTTQSTDHQSDTTMNIIQGAEMGTGSADWRWSSIQWNDQHTHTVGGKGTAHNNMPPYLAVYMWKRTA